MQNVGLLANITTPSMQTQQSVKTLGLPNQHLTLQGKLLTTMLLNNKNSTSSFLDDQKLMNNTENRLTEKGVIPVPL